MDLLTIGEFARLSRLSPKALRLYDELGLLRPAQVDPTTGYRYYQPEQLERARLVLWLRRIGMPLATVREVCDRDPASAAAEIRAFWAEVEEDTAARRDLVTFLVDHLSRRGDPAPDIAPAAHRWAIRYAALTDAGRVRPTNQDAVLAGSHVLAVADGFGTDGAAASTAAVDAIGALESTPVAADLLNLLEDAALQANEAIRGIAESRAGVGTTLTAMLWSGTQLALVHIGDSRAYLLRDGELLQITHDHTLVQSMVDDGRLSAAEAESHPQRSLLVKALAGDPENATPDLHLHDARPGDRYVLCSDGLSAVVPDTEIRELLSAAASPEDATRELVAAAIGAGGPDNVSCVVADVVEPAW
ncbi:MerR family transcriptional regulator [Pseudonocardia sp. TRM90224]|uniref:MerR family transcriptional regulator n=1 Tax=Pseudonocardia sp. TRM90224 TaxID=2812678 RepID=UPI001E3ACF77|nr:MerR family transcriptional regulator [Pseudonocardia sp. TRM90224]